jgi:hypothetical protein
MPWPPWRRRQRARTDPPLKRWGFVGVDELLWWWLPGNAGDTISQLEAQGNRVIVNRLSDAPLSQASVVGINRGTDIRSTVMDDFNDRTYQNTITGHVIYLDVK